MKKEKLSPIWKKLLALWLVIVFGSILPLSSFTRTVKADTNATTQSNNNNLKNEDETGKNQVEALGFSSDQPVRTDATGKAIDKNTTNPLGSKGLNLHKFYQLAITGKNSNTNINDYKNPIGDKGINYADNINLNNTSVSAWSNAEKAVVGADINGTGRDAIITVGIPVISSGTVSLRLLVTEYNEGSPINREFNLISSMPKPYDHGNLDYPIRAAAGDFDHDGKDEVAIVVGRNLYIYRVTDSSVTLISSTIFDNNNSVAKVPYSPEDYPVMDVQAADSDGDGYKELLVTTGSSNGGETYTPRLLIYNGTNLEKPCGNIQLKLKNNNSDVFMSPSVAVGDLFGTGQVIVIGGKTTQGIIEMTYIGYEPESDTYDTLADSGHPSYTLDIPGIISNLIGVKCVSLDTIKSGDPQCVVVGDMIFRYNKDTDVFDKQIVSNATNDSGKKSNNSGRITDLNKSNTYKKGGDRTGIIGTIVGNFDGNSKGKEQIIMLNYNSYYGGYYEYVTWCGKDSKGIISSNMTKLWYGKKSSVINDNYPMITQTCLYNNGLRLEYEPDKTLFTFSNPTVVAVLGASPFYNELSNEYQALGNATTTYGLESESGNSESNGVTASVGVTFGYKHELTILGVKIEEFSVETEIENSFARTWTTSKSVTKSISYSDYSSDDAVVATVIPYDVYYYKVTDANNYEDEIAVSVPYEPLTKIMSLTYYNNAVKDMKNAPVISHDVLHHTLGDPRTYLFSGDVNKLSNISGKKTLLGSDGSGNTYTSSGLGNSTVEQSITTSTTTETTFDYNLNVKVSVNAEIGGIIVGASVGLGYSRSVSGSNTKATIYSGSVAGLPEDYSKFEFRWCLAAYNYNLDLGAGSTQECIVINYLTKPVGSDFPPSVPQNVRVKDGTTTSVSSTIAWDRVLNAAGYRVMRSTDAGGPFSKVADLAGNSYTSYADSGLDFNKTYYYRVVSYTDIDSVQSDPALKINLVYVDNISMKKQPKLIYNDGDYLDLTGLVVSVHNSDGTSKDISYTDFKQNNITVFPLNGKQLVTSDIGEPILISYTQADKTFTVSTNGVIVNAQGNNNFTVNVKFKIGSTDNATKLVANQMMNANIVIKSNQDSAQKIMVILALYDDKGSMVKMSYIGKNILPGATQTANEGLLLPSSIENYTAKVLVWDGDSITDGAQTPEANMVQIP